MRGVGFKTKDSHISDRYLIKKTISDDARLSIHLANDLNAPTKEFIIRTFALSEDQNLEELNSLLQKYHEIPISCGSYLYDYELTDHHVTLVTPYFKTMNLAQAFKSGTFKKSDVLPLAESLLSILQEYEKRGIQHANISPRSILIVTPSQYVLDSFHLPFEKEILIQHKKTNIEDIFYVSPEQAGLLRQDSNISSDLYSLGAVLYEALFGQIPFYADNLAKIFQKKLQEPSKSLNVHVKGVDRSLEDLVFRLLHKNPKDRYQTVDGVLYDVKLIRHHEDQKNIVIGQHDIRKTVSVPAYVGRESVQYTLEKTFQQTLKGHGLIVCVQAKPGEGKSIILHEIEHLSPENFLYFYAQGDSDHRSPFYMFESVLKQIAEYCDAHPQFRARFASYLKKETFESSDEVVNFLNTLGKHEKPVTLIFDDFHYADKETYQALELWKSKRPENTFTSVFLGVSPTDVDMQTVSFAELYISLGAFNEKEMESYLQSMAGPLSVDIVKTIHDISEGNPFFARAMLEGFEENKTISWVDGKWILNESMLVKAQSSKHAAELLANRVRIFDPVYARVLKIAALLGRDFSLYDLKNLTSYSEAKLAETIEIAKQEHFIIPRPNSYFGFSHEKIRESLLSMLSFEEKRADHLAISKYLLTRHDYKDSEIAYHLSQAKDFEAAFPFAYRAAFVTKKEGAYNLSAEQFKIARMGIPSSDNDILKFRIALELGIVYKLQKHFEAAFIEFQRAKGYAKTHYDRASVLLQFGELDFEKGNFIQACNALDLGLQELGEKAPEYKGKYSYTLFNFFAYFKYAYLKFYYKFPYFNKSNFESKKLAFRIYRYFSAASSLCKNVDFSLYLAKKQLRYAKLYGTKDEQAYAYSIVSYMYSSFGFFKKALRFNEKIISFEDMNPSEALKHHASKSLGMAYYTSSQFDSAIGHFKVVNPKNLWDLRRLYYFMGLALYRQGKFKESNEYAHKLFDYGSAITDSCAVACSLYLLTLTSSNRLDIKLIESEKKKTGEDDIRFIFNLFTEAMSEFRDYKFEKANACIQEIWDIVKRTGIRNEVLCSLACFESKVLRTWFENTTPYQAFFRSHLLEKLHFSLARARHYLEYYPNENPTYFREYAYYSVFKNNYENALLYINKSIDHARIFGFNKELEHSLQAFEKINLFTEKSPTFAFNTRKELKIGEEKSNGLTLSLLDRFDSILSLGRLIAGALTEEDVYRQMGVAIESLLRCSQFAVLVFDEKLGYYKQVYGPYTQNCNENYISKTIASRHSMIFSWGSRNTSEHSVLCTPLRVHDLTQICVYIVSEAEGDFFGKDEQSLADFISALAGTALENSRSFKKVELLSQSLEKDIEERQEAERKLQSLLKEKELILREVFHRTKNNMQIVTSMLNLQAINDKTSLHDIIKECQNRIYSISLVHDKLLHSHDLSNISVSSYIQDLVEGIKKSYVLVNNKIQFQIDTDDSQLSLDHAVPCGLILNEIVTNSIKYAFPNADDALIRIKASKSKDTNVFSLTVSDNGVGLPTNFDLNSVSSLGMKLINDLVKIQLGGTLNITQDNGIKYSIFFSDSQYMRRI